MTDDQGETKSANEAKDAAAVKGHPPLYYLTAVGIGELVHRLVYPLPIEMPGIGPLSPLVVRIGVGALVFVIALVGVVSLVRMFSKTDQTPDTWTPTKTVLSGGLYQFSRNPMYLLVAVAQAGLGIGLGDLWVVLLTLPVLVLVRFWAIAPEEAYLEAKFGKAYLDYKVSVRRWLWDGCFASMRTRIQR